MIDGGRCFFSSLSFSSENRNEFYTARKMLKSESLTENNEYHIKNLEGNFN